MGKAIMSMDVETKSAMRVMNKLVKSSIPHAVADSLNETADAVTGQQIKVVKKMINRTPYTMKSMQSARAKPYRALNKAGGVDLQKMFSKSGSFSSYLWKQDKGGTFKPESGGAMPIATDMARTGKNQRKAVAKRYRLKPGKIDDGAFGSDGKQFVGEAKGNGRRRGLYIRSGKNKLIMLRNLESDSIRIKPTGFHSKSVKKFGTGQFISARFRKNAEKYIRKAANGGI